MREARRDHDKIKEREEEESQMSLRELKNIQRDAEEILSDARESLTEDKEHLISVAEGIGEAIDEPIRTIYPVITVYVTVDELLVNLEEGSDRSDSQYWEMQDELRAEGFTNLCRQERLAEKCFWLKKKKKKEKELTSKEREMEITSVGDKQVQELSSNREEQRMICMEQLEGLKRRLSVVVATAMKEELYHCEADQVLYLDIFIHMHT